MDEIESRHPGPWEVRVTHGFANRILAWAGAVQAGSEHPIGRAVALAAEDRTGVLAPVIDFRAHPGFGVEGTVEGRHLDCARPESLTQRGHSMSSSLLADAQRFEASGLVVVGVSVAREIVALFAVANLVRPTSAEAVRRLKSLGLKSVLVTGDHDVAGRRVGAAVGVDEVVSNISPAGKSR